MKKESNKSLGIPKMTPEERKETDASDNLVGPPGEFKMTSEA